MSSPNEPLNYQKAPALTSQEFEQLSKLVYQHCGINLEISKKVMLESRLAKRLRALSMSTFREYISHINTHQGMESELIPMIDVVTTNKTDFFREPHHFEFLTSTVLPQFLSEQQRRPFRIWSSACSTGEEPYTLAIVLQEFVTSHPGFSYSITASDISTKVLEKAMAAIYPITHVQDMPLFLKQRYLLKSKDKDKPTVRIVPDLRNKIFFTRLNLMDANIAIEGNLDVIFCRNVLIYFDRKTQYDVVTKLVRKLRPGGYLFIGHSESLHQFDLPIQQVRPTIFVRKN